MEYRSSPGAIRDFMASSVWHDMKHELDRAVEILRDGLETADDYNGILRFQGSLDTVKRILVMPEVILDAIEAESEKGATEAKEVEYEDKLI